MRYWFWTVVVGVCLTSGAWAQESSGWKTFTAGQTTDLAIRLPSGTDILLPMADTPGLLCGVVQKG